MGYRPNTIPSEKKFMTIETYEAFIGIDIGKHNFDYCLLDKGQKPSKPKQLPNTVEGFSAFEAEFLAILPQAFLVLEVTGGYEREMAEWLVGRGYHLHRASGRKVRQFVLSFGKYGKSDTLDAKALAFYGQERHSILPLFQPLSETAQRLQILQALRADFVETRKQMVTRTKAPLYGAAGSHFEPIIATLSTQICAVEAEMAQLIAKDEALTGKIALLKTIPGLGEVTAQALVILLPELGTLGRREIASLAGLAPHPFQSGEKVGLRRVKGGRREVRPLLFMSAMAAGRTKEAKLGKFYRDLLERGKKPKVALTAVMRKIVVIANAKIRDRLAGKPDQEETKLKPIALTLA